MKKKKNSVSRIKFKIIKFFIHLKLWFYKLIKIQKGKKNISLDFKTFM